MPVGLTVVVTNVSTRYEEERRPSFLFVLQGQLVPNSRLIKVRSPQVFRAGMAAYGQRPFIARVHFLSEFLALWQSKTTTPPPRSNSSFSITLPFATFYMNADGIDSKQLMRLPRFM